jgi:hypothetical protein
MTQAVLAKYLFCHSQRAWLVLRKRKDYAKIGKVQ